MRRLLPLAPTGARLLFAATAVSALADIVLLCVGGAGLGPDYPLFITLALAAAGCIWRAARLREGRALWVFVTLAIVTWLGAETSYQWLFAGSDYSPADVLWLAYFPLLSIGMALALRERMHSVTRAYWLDTAIGIAAMTAVMAALIFDFAPSGHVIGVIVQAAYPVGDVLLIGAVVGVLVLGGSGWSLLWGLMVVSCLANVGSDVFYLKENAAGTWQEWSPEATGWTIAALTLATAAWQHDRPASQKRSWSPLVLPTLFGVLSGTVLVWDHFQRLPLASIICAALGVSLVMVRFSMVFRDNLRLLELTRDEAITDELTGLRNRRSLMLDLERATADTMLALYDLDGFKNYNDTFGHPAGDELLARLGARLETVAAEAGARAYRLGGDEFCLVAPLAESTAEDLAARGARGLVEAGDGFSINASYGFAVLGEAGSLEQLLRDADRRMYAAKNGGRRSSRGVSAADALLLAVNERHPDLGDHGGDVACLSQEVATALGMGPGETERVRAAAELHDIGKIAIPDAILSKPGPLTEDEWRFMKRHTLIGQRILVAADLSDIASVVRASHERWDGGGYPDGLAGEEIPLAARIVMACDAYDAMTTRRAYREPMSADEALAELRRCSGSQFDPQVVDALVSVLEQARAAR